MRVLVYGMVGTNSGGIENYLLKMNQYMSKDIIFDYVIEGSECIHQKDIQKKGGKIYFITSRRKNTVKCIFQINQILNEHRKEIDAIYFNMSSLSWIAPINIAVKKGYRVYIHSHNAEFISANNDFIHRLVNKINKKRLSKLKVKRLSCSEPATEFMFNKTDSVQMIYNAIDTEKFRFNVENRKRIRKKLDIADHEKIIGFVGRIDDQKNPLFIPKLLKELLKDRNDIKVLIIGDGRLRNKLDQLFKELYLSNKVSIIKRTKYVNEFMSAMDVFILPSFHEGLPYVGVEAQTSGLYCFFSDKVTKEVDITGNISFLPLTDDAVNWANNINTYLNQSDRQDRKKWADIVKNSRFDIQKEAKRLEKILESAY